MAFRGVSLPKKSQVSSCLSTLRVFNASNETIETEGALQGTRNVSTQNLVKLKLKTMRDVPSAALGINWSILKTLFQLESPQKRIAEIWHNAFKKYGDVVKIPTSFGPTVLVSNPEVAEEICRIEDKMPWPSHKGITRSILQPIVDSRQKYNIPSGLPVMEGEEWLENRNGMSKKLLRPIEIKKYFDEFNELAEITMTIIKSQRTSNDVLEDLKPLLGKWSLEGFGIFCLGRSMGLFSGTPDKKIVEMLSDLSEYVGLSGLLCMGKWAKVIFPDKYKQLNAITEKAHRIGLELVKSTATRIQDAIDKGQVEEDRSTRSLLGHFLMNTNLSMDAIVTHSVDLCTAAVDTTTNAAGWLLYNLGNNPGVQQELRKEIDDIVPKNEKVTYDMVQRMPYLSMCLKENSRLNPVGAIVIRDYDFEIEAGGYLFPPKTLFFISNYNMGRNEEWFADENEFRPERWSREGHKEEGKKKVHPFSSLPFGYGARSCVGRRVSEAEIKSLIVNLVRNFKFKYIGKEQKGALKPTFCAEHPLNFVFQDRN